MFEEELPADNPGLQCSALKAETDGGTSGFTTDKSAEEAMCPVPRVENVNVLLSTVRGTFKALSLFPDRLLLAAKQLFGAIWSPLVVDVTGTLETIIGVVFNDSSGFVFVPSVLDVNPGLPMLWMLVLEEVQDKVPKLGTTFNACVPAEEMLTSEVDVSFGMISAELLMNMTRDPGTVQVAVVVVVTFEGIFGEGVTRKTFWKVDWSGVVLPGGALFCGGFVPHLATIFC